ncbi:GNAT family N-acetyltransferase [Thermoactinospora rubra]|uniref:GNAT family N-acetyltransferase n=1 Tax=Thermoactinospora rubra TaxID=1088767 RepID=UPI000A0FBDC2|nr:GNAT family N-acetyltransferase [Thermoactinospora rubra]
MIRTQIRSVRPDDETAITRFLAGLSLQTQTLRFFSGFHTPKPSLVRALMALDERRDALVATLEGEIVGHAMSYRGGAADVEVAVVVADQWQGCGIGPRLVDALLARAWLRGAVTVGMDVLGENRRVLRMIRRAWPEAKLTVSSGSVAVVAMIDPAPLFAEQGSGVSPLML